MAHKVLEGYYLNGVVVYIDDTVVYGKHASSFLKMLDLLLDRKAKFNVRLKPSKCSFGMTSVEFLGHIFDEYGVHLSDKRVQGIKDLPIPRTPNDGNSELIGVDTSQKEDDTMLDWAAVKDLAALDDYSKENPHLNLG